MGGRNHYPQDVEQSVERAASAVRRGCVAAFTAPDDPELVIVAEVREAADPAETVAAIRAAVSADHGLDIAAVVLIEPRTLPKTTSGKIRRGACRDKYLSGALTVRHEWRAPGLKPGRASRPRPSRSNPGSSPMSRCTPGSTCARSMPQAVRQPGPGLSQRGRAERSAGPVARPASRGDRRLRSSDDRCPCTAPGRARALAPGRARA